MKKWLSLLLAVLMLFTLAACKTNKETPNDTPNDTGDSVAEPSDSETEVETDEWGQHILDPTVPIEDLDYGGATVNIYVNSMQQYRREWFTEEPANALDQAIFSRNEKIQDELGVYFNFITENGTVSDAGAAYNNRIINTGKAGLGGMDIVSNMQCYATNANLLEYYTNLYNEQLTYLNLERPYWNQKFISAGEAYGRLFVAVGDMNLSVYDRAIATYFNKDLASVNNIDPNDLYQLVLDGGWTYEVLYDYVKDFHYGGNSDPFLDTYGLTSISGSEYPDGWLYATGCYLTVTNDDGSHSLVSGSMLDKLDDVMSKILRLRNAEGVYLQSSTANNYTMFTTGRALFNIDVIYHHESGNLQMRDMTDKYGLLPMPKYDETQKEYLSAVQDTANVMSVMYHSRQNYEMVSAVLELLCSESYSSVRPYYFEKIVKLQYLDDPTAGEVFDLILAGTYWDFSEIYGAALGAIRSDIWRGAFRNQTSIPNRFETYGDTFTANLKEFDKWLETHY